MKILLAGGGTLGPVTPLLPVIRRIREMQKDVSFVWVGTPSGPERAVVEAEGIRFLSIPIAKLPRYASLKILLWPFAYARAAVEARWVILKEQPDMVAGAGGFTQVPVIRAAARRGIPCVIHQLDAQVGLANRFVASRCQYVTTSLEKARAEFPPSVHVVPVSTPCRYSHLRGSSHAEATAFFGFNPAKVTVFVVGGGTGSAALNGIVPELRGHFRDVQFIHSTGRGKLENQRSGEGYVVQEFFDEQMLLRAYSAADVVVCRAGFGTLSDLACLSKAAIVVPIPRSHQEENARAVDHGVLIVPQKDGFAQEVVGALRELLHQPDVREEMGLDLHRILPTDDGAMLAQKWLSVLRHP